MRGAVRERQLSHQQRDGETDTAGDRQTNDVDPFHVRVEVGVFEPGDQPGGACDTQGLTDHECEDNADCYRVGEGPAQPVETAQGYTRAEKGENGHADTGGNGAEPVFEDLREAGVGASGFGAFIEFHGYAEAQNHARDGRVNT